MSLKINFYCNKRYKELIPEPIPAYVNFPKWFSDLQGKNKCPFRFGNTIFQLGKSHQNLKGCLGIVDYLKLGYIIPSWSEFIFRELDDGNLFVNWLDHSEYPSSYHAHTSEQFETMPNKPLYGHFSKIVSPWTITTEKGVSCLITHPVWNRKNNFTTSTGVFHTDQSPLNIPWFFEWNYKIFSGMEIESMNIDQQVIKIGDPIIHIIPFYRKDYKMNINYVSENEIKRMHLLQKTNTIGLASQTRYNKIRKTFGKLFS